MNKSGEKSFKSAEKSRELYDKEKSAELAKIHANEVTYSITSYTQAIFIGLMSNDMDWDIEDNLKYVNSNLIHDPIFGQNQAKTKQIARQTYPLITMGFVMLAGWAHLKQLVSMKTVE